MRDFSEFEENEERGEDPQDQWRDENALFEILIIIAGEGRVLKKIIIFTDFTTADAFNEKENVSWLKKHKKKVKARPVKVWFFIKYLSISKDQINKTAQEMV